VFEGLFFSEMASMKRKILITGSSGKQISELLKDEFEVIDVDFSISKFCLLMRILYSLFCYRLLNIDLFSHATLCKILDKFSL